MLTRSIVFGLFMVFSIPATVSAQWVVSVVEPPGKTAPIGSCVAISLKVLDTKTSDVPRRPNGDRVTVADFDMSISPSGSFAGYWLDQYHWLACGCQRASVGSIGTISATYPSSLLNTQRVAGIAASATGSFSLSVAQGTFQPKVCSDALAAAKPLPPGESALATRNAAPAPILQPAAAAPAIMKPTTGAAPAPTQPAPTQPAPISPAPIVRPAAPPIATTPPPTGTAPSAPAPSAPVTGPQTIGGAIAPVGLPSIPPEVLAEWARLGIPLSADSVWGRSPAELDKLLRSWIATMTGTQPGTAGGTSVGAPIGQALPRTATPTPMPATNPLGNEVAPLAIYFNQSFPELRVTWTPPNGTRTPIGYTVERWKTSSPDSCKAASGPVTSEWVDVVTDGGPWTYKVTAQYADQNFGAKVSGYVPLTLSYAVAPLGFKAQQLKGDTVALTWSPIAAGSYYLVAGPPSNTAIRVEQSINPRYLMAGVPAGASTFKLATMYVGKFKGAQQSSEFVTTTLNAVTAPQFRVIAESFKATSETVDAPLSEDGKYDEIFVAAYSVVMDRRDGAASRPEFHVSPVYGDVTFRPPPQRVQAGSASANGGIRAGDFVRLAPEMTLWQGELDSVAVLIVHPTIWESDTDSPTDRDPATQYCRDPSAFGAVPNCRPCYFCSWAGRVQSVGTMRNTSPLIASPGIEQEERYVMFIGDDSELHNLEVQDQNRPLGLEGSNYSALPKYGIVGQFRDRIVVITREKIDAVLAKGTNKIEVRFWDHWNKPGIPPSTVSYLNGDYLLTLRIERVQ